jgi:hypothetical protein
MKLNYGEVCYKQTNYNDLQNFLSFHIGTNVEIMWRGNDTDETYTVEKDNQFWDEEEYKELLARERIPAKSYGTLTIPESVNYEEYEVGTLLEGLCREGKLEEGSYLVTVSW